MKKNYIAPQIEATPLSSEIIMDSINVIHHSGGSNESGEGGFIDEGDII